MLRHPGWTSVLGFGLLLLTLNAAVAQQRRTALVIGNATYKDSPLTNPVNDATDMAATLKRLGFDVTRLLNANLQTMEDTIEAFGLKLRQGGLGLFYFAGHGVQIDGENYLIPVGELIGSQVQARSRSVAVGNILGAMRDARNEINVVILDACRNNPLPKSDRALQRGLAMPIAQTRGTLIAYATSPGETASDGNSRNGVYTQYLLQHITTPGLKVEDVFKNVRRDVDKATQSKQLPWELSSLSGDFYFTGPGSTSASAVLPPEAIQPPPTSSGPTKSSKLGTGDAGSQPRPGVKAVPLAAGAQPQLGPQVAVGVYPPTVQTPTPGRSFETRHNSIGMELVLIPPGEFMMGSENGDPDEKPLHKVIIKNSFYLGKHEVTQAQWQEVMGTNPSHFKGDPNRPVERVSWKMAQEFIRKLNEREGHTLYRLPTEAEWEYAARAGSKGKYTFGDEDTLLEQYAWYSKNDKGTTHPVGQLKPNTWGLYDMHGNVWEWVQDWRGPYAAETAVDPAGPPTGNARGYRGGGWGYGPERCKSAKRSYDSPDYVYGTHGFRLAMSPK